MVLTMTTLCCMQACVTGDDEEQQTETNTAVRLALSASSLPSQSTTRMSEDIVQAQSTAVFRGVQDLTLIPFLVEGKIKSGDTPLDAITKDLEGNSLAIEGYGVDGTGKTYKFFDIDPFQVSLNTASFLSYGRAIPASGKDQFHNGALTASYTTDSKYAPNDITFTPTAIYADDSKQDAILEYLNSIANATVVDGTENKWKEATGEWQTLFREFAGYVEANTSYMRFAGSSRNLVKHIQIWEKKLAGEEGTESIGQGAPANNILAAIRNTDYVTIDESKSKNKVTGFKSTIAAYPTNLPDGAAGIKWDNSTNKFVADNENDFTKYSYPAELWYYGNSRIYTDPNIKSTTTGSSPWETIIGSYANKGEGNEGTVIDTKTHSVGIKDKMQYGVARLDVHIQAGGNSLSAMELNDNEKTINLSEATNKLFPLTAILIGGQHQQGFDLTPKNPDANASESDDKEYIIYDRSIADEGIYLSDYLRTTDGTTHVDKYSKALHTLVLQTKINKSVKVVLEFDNNYGDFKSANGIIYKGTKFYLMASVEIATEAPDAESRDQVFTKDHITTINLTINNLLPAYNTLPNMNSDKVRLFETVQAAIKTWGTGQTIEHPAYNW